MSLNETLFKSSKISYCQKVIDAVENLISAINCCIYYLKNIFMSTIILHKSYTSLQRTYRILVL